MNKDNKNVELNDTGKKLHISDVSRSLSDILYELYDNAFDIGAERENGDITLSGCNKYRNDKIERVIKEILSLNYD